MDRKHALLNGVIPPETSDYVDLATELEQAREAIRWANTVFNRHRLLWMEDYAPAVRAALEWGSSHA